MSPGVTGRSPTVTFTRAPTNGTPLERATWTSTAAGATPDKSTENTVDWPGGSQSDSMNVWNPAAETLSVISSEGSPVVFEYPCALVIPLDTTPVRTTAYSIGTAPEAASTRTESEAGDARRHVPLNRFPAALPPLMSSVSLP